jgi:hypothetical protein
LKRIGHYLDAIADAVKSADANISIDAIAKRHAIEPAALNRWLAYFGLGGDGRLLARASKSLLNSKGIEVWQGPTGDTPWFSANTNNQAVTLLTFVLPARSISVHPGPTESVGVVWTSPVAGRIEIQGKLADSDPSGGDGITWLLEHRDGLAWKSVRSGMIDNGGSMVLPITSVVVKPGDSVRLLVGPRGEYTCDTTTIDLTLKSESTRTEWNLTKDLVPNLLTSNPHSDRFGHPVAWRFVTIDQSKLARADLTSSPLANWLRALKDGSDMKLETNAILAALNDPKSRPFRDSLLAPSGPLTPSRPELPADAQARFSKRQAEIDRLRANPPAPIPLGIVAQEGGVPKSKYEGVRDTNILARGEYTKPGVVVPRHFPVIFGGDGSPPKMRGSGRQELANWIARADHPLTARVMVNRLWEFHLGEGIVRTPSNFGKLGERPTNPELLDHLASMFIKQGWSIKQMHRLIMTSSTYQQSSIGRAETVKTDPSNRLFGRMNRRRIESDAIRDSLLFVAGRLNPTMGGPSYRDFDTPRRTLYLMTIRSDRSSFGPLFDSADATAIVDKRVESTVAPQALFLLNNPFAIEAAKGFAQRILRESKTKGDRLDQCYRLAFGRPPSAQELAIAETFVGSDNDLQKWSTFLHVLICGNEFLFVD